MVNGEIYDYPALRKEMETLLKYPFNSTSDSELVLALYKYHGISFVSHLRGEFSICLYDADRELFIAVRDRYGIKPLFWTVQPSPTKATTTELWIAAEQKAFLGHGWQPRWDLESIRSGAFQIGASTIFHSIQKVPPGHILLVRNFQPNSIHTQPYWDATSYADKSMPDPRSDAEMITTTRQLLLDAVRQRLRADVRVGVSLSGGLDSSVVAGMVAHLMRTEGLQVGSAPASERLCCFGIGFDSASGFDESEEAVKTAEWLGVKFHRKLMDERSMVEMFADATWHDEQPNPDLNFVGVFALSELFREHGFRVNVNGQGSDEIFGGYNVFLPDVLREWDGQSQGVGAGESDVDGKFRRSEMRKAEVVLNEVYGGRLDLDHNLDHTYAASQPPNQSVARRQLNNILTPSQMALAFPTLPFKAELLGPSTAPPLTTLATTVAMTTTTNPIPRTLLTYTHLLSPHILSLIRHKWHPLHAAQHIFIKAHLQNLLLSNLGDRGEMAHGVEGRTPFLDHHVTEYVDGCGVGVKVRWCADWDEDVETGPGGLSDGGVGGKSGKDGQDIKHIPSHDDPISIPTQDLTGLGAEVVAAQEQHGFSDQTRERKEAYQAHEILAHPTPQTQAHTQTKQPTTKGQGEWVEKWLLRQAGREFVRPEIYRKKKHPYSAPVRWRKVKTNSSAFDGVGSHVDPDIGDRGEGMLYTLIKSLVTRENIEGLGFLDPEGVEGLVERAFVDVDIGEQGKGKEGGGGGDKNAFRLVICLAQWVVLGKRFGVKRYVQFEEDGDEEESGDEEDGVEAGERSREGENLMLG